MKSILLGTAACLGLAGAAAACPDFRLQPNGMLSMGEVELSQGQAINIVAGGNVNVQFCPGIVPVNSPFLGGFFISNPDLSVNLSGVAGAELVVATNSPDPSCDTVLLANDPASQWYWNDDAAGLQSELRIPNIQNGRIDIWVGTFGGQLCPTVLTLQAVGGAADPGTGDGKPPEEQAVTPVPQPVQPQPVQPQPVQPQPVQPQPVQPQPVQPQPVQPQPVQPQPVEPQPVQPQPVEPQPVQPQPVEPQPIDEVEEPQAEVIETPPPIPEAEVVETPPPLPVETPPTVETDEVTEETTVDQTPPPLPTEAEAAEESADGAAEEATEDAVDEAVDAVDEAANEAIEEAADAVEMIVDAEICEAITGECEDGDAACIATVAACAELEDPSEEVEETDN